MLGRKLSSPAALPLREQVPGATNRMNLSWTVHTDGVVDSIVTAVVKPRVGDFVVVMKYANQAKPMVCDHSFME